MSETRGRGPGVDFPPPAFYLVGFLIGVLLEKYVVDLLPDSRSAVQTVVDMAGGLLVGIGVGTVFLGMATFRRMQTAIYPNRDASRLVRSGPYRWTRNPMYTGLTLVYLGASLMLSVGWAIVALPFVLLVIQRYVIASEERYLTEAFGDEYREYQRQVRRWL